jgi:nucleotide-binding universal stress UspA family protein
MNTAIKKILMPVDFTEASETVISKATTLAKLLKADLLLLHVVAYNGFGFSILPESKNDLPTITELEKAVSKKMDEMQAEIRKRHGITVEVYVSTGNVDTEVIDFAKNKKIDLIIMGTHGASGYKEMFIGSNAQRVVTLSDVPVLTMQKDTDKLGFENILLPIDNSIHSREKVILATAVARQFGAKIHVLGLADSTDKTEINKFKIKVESVEKHLTTANLPYKTTIAEGHNLAASAMEYAEKNKCDLIIINTGHESKITGIFLGAFAQQIVNHSKVPVLSMKHLSDHYSIETDGFGA